MAMFLVVSERSGPSWRAGRALEGLAAHAAYLDRVVESGLIVPVGDGLRVALAIEAEPRAEADPWEVSHLRTVSIDPWTIRPDGRAHSPPGVT